MRIRKIISFTLLLAGACCLRSERVPQDQSDASEIQATTRENELTSASEWSHGEGAPDASMAKLLGSSRVFQATKEGGQRQRIMLLRRADGAEEELGVVGEEQTVIALFDSLSLRADSEVAARNLAKLASQLTTNNAMQADCRWDLSVHSEKPFVVAGSCRSPEMASTEWVLKFDARFDSSGRLEAFTQLGFK